MILLRTLVLLGDFGDVEVIWQKGSFDARHAFIASKMKETRFFAIRPKIPPVSRLSLDDLRGMGIPLELETLYMAGKIECAPREKANSSFHILKRVDDAEEGARNSLIGVPII